MKLLDSVQRDRAHAIATALDPHLTDRTHEVIFLLFVVQFILRYLGYEQRWLTMKTLSFSPLERFQWLPLDQPKKKGERLQSIALFFIWECSYWYWFFSQLNEDINLNKLHIRFGIILRQVRMCNSYDEASGLVFKELRMTIIIWFYVELVTVV